jgi:hypothetical protein
VANASHVLPNGAAVRNARSLATICRAICSFEFAVSRRSVGIERPGPQNGPGQFWPKRDYERETRRIARALIIAVKRFGFANDGPVDRLSTAVGHDGILQRRYAGKTQARCSAIKAAVQSGERRDTLALTVGSSGCPGERQLRLIDERKLVVGEPATVIGADCDQSNAPLGIIEAEKCRVITGGDARATDRGLGYGRQQLALAVKDLNSCRNCTISWAQLEADPGDGPLQGERDCPRSTAA